MDLDDADRAFIDTLVPDESVATGIVAVVTFIDPATGQTQWRTYCDVDMPVSTTLGFLELAKLDIIARSNTGLPVNYPPGHPYRHPGYEPDEDS